MTNEPRTLSIDRRTLVGGSAAALVAARHGFAARATDATGRAIIAADRVTRVYPAGPPAAVLLYTFAPDPRRGSGKTRALLTPTAAQIERVLAGSD
jgi:hypothetical protein